MLYTFGKIVEEEEGAAAVWITYVVCSAGEAAKDIALVLLSMPAYHVWVLVAAMRASVAVHILLVALL
jgi:hypothetical protein